MGNGMGCGTIMIHELDVECDGIIAVEWNDRANLIAKAVERNYNMSTTVDYD